MPEIHPTAIVDPAAKLADDVRIGPYCIIDGDVEMGAGSVVESHAVVTGRTTMGPGCHVFPFAAIGHRPQDLKYAGEPSRLEIGAKNVIREHVTMNPGTEGGGMLTKVGDGCLFMVGAHVAHDCQLGNNVIMANNATLAGHVVIEDFAILGGLTAIHQFVRIGAHAIVGGMSGVENDVIPYGSVMGDRARLVGLNLVGLRRRGFSREMIHVLRSAYRMLFAPEGTMAERLEDVDEMFQDNEAARDIIRFIKTESSRAICQPKEESGS
jgi:UDP-N-acetylglucosamine acyltransferase